MYLNWLGLPFQTMLLGIEAFSVIGLRMEKFASGGPGVFAEASRMIIEKNSALQEAAATLIGGGSMDKVVRRYRTHVQANETRLLAGR